MARWSRRLARGPGTVRGEHREHAVAKDPELIAWTLADLASGEQLDHLLVVDVVLGHRGLEPGCPTLLGVFGELTEGRHDLPCRRSTEIRIWLDVRGEEALEAHEGGFDVVRRIAGEHRGHDVAQAGRPFVADALHEGAVELAVEGRVRLAATVQLDVLEHGAGATGGLDLVRGAHDRTEVLGGIDGVEAIAIEVLPHVREGEHVPTDEGRTVQVAAIDPAGSPDRHHGGPIRVQVHERLDLTLDAVLADDLHGPRVVGVTHDPKDRELAHERVDTRFREHELHEVRAGLGVTNGALAVFVAPLQGAADVVEGASEDDREARDVRAFHGGREDERHRVVTHDVAHAVAGVHGVGLEAPAVQNGHTAIHRLHSFLQKLGRREAVPVGLLALLRDRGETSLVKLHEPGVGRRLVGEQGTKSFQHV